MSFLVAQGVWSGETGKPSRMASTQVFPASNHFASSCKVAILAPFTLQLESIGTVLPDTVHREGHHDPRSNSDAIPPQFD